MLDDELKFREYDEIDKVLRGINGLDSNDARILIIIKLILGFILF